MAQLKPFKAWRPKPDLVSEIGCVPYDVVDTELARKLAEGKPKSFLHVIRPEINLENGIDIYSEEVYQIGKKTLQKFLSSDDFEQDTNENLYIYRLTWKGQQRTGIFGCISVDDYDSNVILKHELTTPVKEDDRTKHILTQKAHAEPVMITFEASMALKETIQKETEKTPIFDFSVEDGVQHTIWRCSYTDSLVNDFEQIPNLYIADGHHRCASASRVANKIDSTLYPEVNYFPAVLFPMDELEILAYNRIVFEVPDSIIEDISTTFKLKKGANPEPVNKGEVSFYFKGNWYGLKLPDSNHSSIASNLDISRLQEFILEPFLEISNQRTDKNISFVGGIHGTSKLEELVDSGKASFAISLYSTDIHELVAVSDAGELMPPKSTWFEPKLRSGLLIHTF